MANVMAKNDIQTWIGQYYRYLEAFMKICLSSLPDDKIPKLAILMDGQSYTDHAVIHIGVGELEPESEEELMASSLFLLGHEMQHCLSTTQKAWAWGQERGLEVVCEHAAKKLGIHVAKDYLQTIDDTVSTLEPRQKLILQAMGDTGISELTPLIEVIIGRAKEEGIKTSESTLRSEVFRLVGVSKNKALEHPLITKETISGVPGPQNLSVYTLTKLGKDVYHTLYGKDPKISEKEELLAAHGTLLHGYGIQRTARVFRDMKFIQNAGAEVIYLTRRNDYMVKVSEKSTYIADIIIIMKKQDGTEARRYIEYETTKCTDEDFYAKCNKMAIVGQYLNFVVPGNAEKEKILARIENWKSQLLKGGGFPGERNLYIRVSTYNELKTGDSRKNIPWATEITVHPPKKRT